MYRSFQKIPSSTPFGLSKYASPWNGWKNACDLSWRPCYWSSHWNWIGFTAATGRAGFDSSGGSNLVLALVKKTFNGQWQKTLDWYSLLSLVTPYPALAVPSLLRNPLMDCCTGMLRLLLIFYFQLQLDGLLLSSHPLLLFFLSASVYLEVMKTASVLKKISFRNRSPQ